MEIFVNGQSHTIVAETTVAALLEALQLADRPIAVEVNLDLVPRERHAEHLIGEGDRLELVTLVGGG